MARRYLEDLQVGESWTSKQVRIEAQDIIDFASRFDPQPFHLDAEAAKASPFGGLVASGWHLASLVMKISVDARTYGDTPVIGMGVDELRWHMPVRPGDVLHIERELVEIVDVPDKPKRGTVKARVDLKNQRDELVMRMVVLTSVPKRKTVQPD